MELFNDEFLEYISGDRDKCILATFEGLMEININDLISQPIEGILYDLNRGAETTLTLMRLNQQLPPVRLINDYAVASVIRALKNRIDELESKNGNV